MHFWWRFEHGIDDSPTVARRGQPRQREQQERKEKEHTMEESKAGGVLPEGSGGDTITEQQVIGTYRGMLGDVNQIRRKISELEQEVSEHQ